MVSCDERVVQRNRNQGLTKMVSFPVGLMTKLEKNRHFSSFMGFLYASDE